MRPTPRRLLLVLLTATALAAGCGRPEYRFNSTVTYDFPQLGLRADIQSRGTVKSGHDLSQDGVSLARFSWLHATSNTIATLSVTNRSATFVAGTNAPVVLDWSQTDIEPAVTRILGALGVTNPPPAAISASASALYGPAFGPKGTGTGSSTEVRTLRFTPGVSR